MGSLTEEDLCLLSQDELAKLISRFKGELPTEIDLPDSTHVIASGETKVIYSVEPIPSYFRRKFYVACWSDVLLKARSFDMNVSFFNGIAKDSIRGIQRYGNPDIVTTWDKNGTKLELSVTNNESQDFTVTYKSLDYL